MLGVVCEGLGDLRGPWATARRGVERGVSRRPTRAHGIVHPNSDGEGEAWCPQARYPPMAV